MPIRILRGDSQEEAFRAGDGPDYKADEIEDKVDKAPVDCGEDGPDEADKIDDESKAQIEDVCLEDVGCWEGSHGGVLGGRALTATFGGWAGMKEFLSPRVTDCQFVD